MSADAVKPKSADPIYGDALPATWLWLWNHAEHAATEEEENAVTAGKSKQRRKTAGPPEARRIDFGIDAIDALLAQHGEDGRIPVDLLAPSAKLVAPVMLPAYVDFWCQTSPRPAPDPDVMLFLHGQQRGEPDVQVCWRGDLTEVGNMKSTQWCDVVSLLPPTSAECMTVPLSRARRWLAQQQPDDRDGDLLGVAADEEQRAGNEDERPTLKRRGVLWRGAKDSVLVESPRDLRPGDTLVMPEAAGGWDELGHVPSLIREGDKRPTPADTDGDAEAAQGRRIDAAEAAFQAARDRAALRLHPSLRSRLPAGSAIDELLDQAADRDNPPTTAEWRELLIGACATLPGDTEGFTATLSRFIDNGLICEPYPDDHGVVLTTRKRLGKPSDWFLPSLDEGDDSASRTRRREPVLLTDHTQHVVKTLRDSLLPLPLDDITDALNHAATLHDLGKADERFQAMLRRTDRTDAWLLTGLTASLIAKSDGLPQTRKQRHAARQRAGLPDGFRHEMLAVQLAQQASDLPEDPMLRDLVLHLIAAHHGYARPFAPVVSDDDPPGVTVEDLSLTTADRLACPSHRLDSGIAEQFWYLTRTFGWWGLAYLESLLRLADQQASAAEDSDAAAEMPHEPATEVTA